MYGGSNAVLKEGRGRIVVSVVLTESETFVIMIK